MYADRQGSVLWVTDPATGEVAAGYEYDGYGAITQTQGSLVQPYGYTGREFDAESGLYYYRARSYDPEAGMFVQSDPIGFGGGQFNLTSAVNSDPFNRNDPTGLMAVPFASQAAAVQTGLIGFVVAGTGVLLENTLQSIWEVGTKLEEDGLIGTGPGQGPGRRDEDDNCWKAKLEKRRAKTIVNALRKCESGMHAAGLTIRGMAFFRLRLARANETRACYNGVPDRNHDDERVNEFENVICCALLATGR